MATSIAPTPGPNQNSFDSTLASAKTTMIFSEVLSLAMDSFCASKARFLLTMLGMVIGSASIILVVTVGMTGKQYALDTISSLGPNKIEMQYRGGSIIGPDNTTTPDYMTREDMEAVHDTVPGIVAYSPLLEDHERISLGSGITNDTMLLGVSPQYKQVRGLIVLAGRFFDNQDADTRQSCSAQSTPGDQTLRQRTGCGRATTSPSIAFPSPSSASSRRASTPTGPPRSTTRPSSSPTEVARYFTGTDNIKEIFFKMADAAMVETGAEQITNVIQHRHRPNSVYHAETLVGILNTMNKVANDLTWMLLIVAAITLVVGGVGIMNSMLANVQSRTHEIGIRKALGATRNEIRLQFLTESVFLSFAGGILGTIVGLGIPLSVGRAVAL